MCTHGYHHNGLMATSALGTLEARLYEIIYSSNMFWNHSGRVFKGELCLF